ncbi:MAG: hypothetical protein IJ998_09030 [Alistipes sp.]|nr:hypothetical protein [Alistipes sp.]
MNTLRYILLLLCVTTASACRNFSEPELNFNIEEQSPIAIEELNQMVIDEAVEVTQPLMIEGYVATSDEASNFHKSFILSDATGGVEIMAGLYDLHVLYPEGQRLYISLQGCTLARSYGVVQVGLKAEEHSGFQVNYFGSRVLLDKHISRSAENREVEPIVRTISQLKPSVCGRLTTIRSLHLASTEYADAWHINTEGRWQGYNIFHDEQGDKIAVYTSDYASYCQHTVPLTAVDITGILQRGEVAGEEMYMLKMSREDDCTNSI